VGQGRGPSLGRDNPKVAGDPSLENDAGFGFPVGHDLFHVGSGDESLHDFLGFFGGGNQVEIFDNLFSTAEAPSDFSLEDDRALAEVREESLGSGKGIAEAVEFAVAGSTGDGLQEIAGRFFAKTIKGGQAAVMAGFLEGFEGLDSQFFPKSPKLFWTEAGEVQESKQSGWNGGAELLEIREFAGLDESGDLFPEGLADSRQFTQPLRADEVLEIRGGGFEGSGGGKVGPAFEGVFPLKFKDRANFA